MFTRDDVITHNNRVDYRHSKAALLRHGSGAGQHDRVRIQQPLHLESLNATSPVQIFFFCLLNEKEKENFSTILFHLCTLLFFPHSNRYKHGNQAESRRGFIRRDLTLRFRYLYALQKQL